MENKEDNAADFLPDPQMLQQLMAVAQAMGQDGAAPGGITAEQRNLLQALQPYLPGDRIRKLEKAMRAAKIARVASSFLHAGGLQLLTGR